MKNLKHEEVKRLAQVHMATKWQAELSFEPRLIGSKIHACKPLRHIAYFSLEELLFGDKFNLRTFLVFLQSPERNFTCVLGPFHKQNSLFLW